MHICKLYIYICIISYICIYIMVCVNPALFSLHVVCYCGHLYLGNDLPTWGIRSYIGLATVAVPSRPICVLAWCARPSTDIKQRFFSCQLCHSVSKIIGSVLSIFVQICWYPVLLQIAQDSTLNHRDGKPSMLVMSKATGWFPWS